MPSEHDTEQLNILFLPGWYPSEQNPTAGNLVREHAKAAAIYHNVVVLYVTRIDTGPRGRWRVVSDRIEEGIRTVRIYWRELPIPMTSYIVHLYVVAAAYRYIRRSGFPPDIIHAHLYFLAPAAVFLGALFRIPAIVTERSPAFPLGDVRGQMLLVVRSFLRHAAMILPVSSWLQQSMQSFGIKGNYRVVPNAIDQDLFFPSPGQHKTDAGRALPRLLTVGLLTRPKGIPVLLRAVHIVKGRGKKLHLDIVGDGLERADYERMSLELGLQDFVTFHGMKPKSEVADFMRQCDFYLQPSLYETFCAAIVEAMTCGKPVIGTQIPVFVEKVNSERGVLVPVGDHVALASAIDNMLDKYESFEAAGIADYARRNYSHEAVGKMLSDIYLEVARH